MNQAEQKRIKFIDYLPDFFREEEEKLTQFLGPFEELFEELRASIEGKEYQTELIGIEDGRFLILKPFDANPLEFIGQESILSQRTKIETDITKIVLPDDQQPVKVQVDKWFVETLKTGEPLTISTGHGIPDLFDPGRRTLVLNQDRTKPYLYREFKYSPPDADFDRIKFLSSWISIPIREDKSFEWNREFLRRAIPLWRNRYTIKGMESLLTEWLKGDVEDSEYLKRPVIVTDLTSKYNRFHHLFCLDRKEPPILGINTILGEGPPNFFMVDIIIDSKDPGLRSKEKLMELFRAVRFFIDREKPAHTYYQLRIRNNTMQLAPNLGEWKEDEIYASTGLTTLLWKGAWIYNGY